MAEKVISVSADQVNLKLVISLDDHGAPEAIRSN